VIDGNGIRFALRTIPVAAAIDPNCDLIITAGSEIRLEVLWDEINTLETAGHDVRSRLLIDPQATIIEDYHIKFEEELIERIGSTGKGIGQARADRLQRRARIADQVKELDEFMGETDAVLNWYHRKGHDVLIEGTQGYHLGLHAGCYPFTTSNDCRTVDFIAAAGITPLRLPETWLVFRTYPIRVAGNSGPLPKETSWQDLSDATAGYIQAERTTVTQKIRRVAEFSSSEAAAAIDGNGGADHPTLHPVLMFVDYLDPSLANATTMGELEHSDAHGWVTHLERRLGVEFEMFGTGPETVIWRSAK
jgi:adenylosuccinate synthase